MCSLQAVTLRGAQAQPLEELQVGVEARIRDPDAAVDADELGNRGPPSILVRLASALMYLVPWIDIIGLGRMMYHKFPATLLLYVIPGASYLNMRMPAIFTALQSGGGNLCTRVGECQNFVNFFPAPNCSYVMPPSCTWHLLWPGACWLHA